MPIPDLGQLLFITLFLMIIGSAFMVVTSSNLVHSAVSLLFTLFGIAGVYVFLYADFIAATQVVIYVGGILVLIIFGVMLTNKIENSTITSKTQNKIPGLLFSILLLVLQFYVIFNTKWLIHENQPIDTTISSIGNLLLTKYLLPFEVVSVLLLAALIGAAMLARKKVVE